MRLTQPPEQETTTSLISLEVQREMKLLRCLPCQDQATIMTGALLVKVKDTNSEESHK